jgi:Ala-tRNA(Pro) deacylase
MGVAITIREFLEERAVDYEVVSHSRTTSALRTAESAHVPGDRLVKGILLGDSQGQVLALIPATHRLDLDRARTVTGRDLQLIDERGIDGTFTDCEPGSVPPFGELYGVETVVDSHLADYKEVYFEAGDHAELIRMRSDVFRDLLGDVPSLHLSRHV